MSGQVLTVRGHAEQEDPAGIYERWQWLRARADWGIATLLGGIAFGAASHRAGELGLHNDEPYSVGVAQQPLDVMWHWIWLREAHMGLYYTLLHIWLGFLHIFGVVPTEFLIRLPSILAAALGGSILYLLGARYWGRLAGTVAALLFATNPLLLYMAQNARSYSLQATLHVLVWYFFLTALHTANAGSRRRWWIAFAAAATLSIYAQVDSIIAFVALPVAFAAFMYIPSPWRDRSREELRHFALSSLAVGLLATPLGLALALHGGNNDWVPVANLESLRSLFVGTIAEGNVRFAAILGTGILAAGLAAIPTQGYAWLTRWWPWRYDAETAVATLAIGCWFVLPLALFWLLTQDLVNLHVFWWRYLVIVVAPLCLLVGIGLSQVRSQLLGVALAALVILATFYQLPRFYASTHAQDAQDAVAWMLQRHQHGDGLLCSPASPDALCAMTMDYYLHTKYQGAEMWPTDYPGDWKWDDTPNMPDRGPAALVYAGQHQRVFLVGGYFGGAVSQQRSDVQALVLELEAHGFKLVSTFTNHDWQVFLLEQGPA